MTTQTSISDQNELISQPLYPSTPFQHYYFHRNIKQFYSCFVVGAKYQFSTQSFTSDQFNFILYHSLRELIHTHPIFALNLSDNGKIVQFLESIQFSDIIVHDKISSEQYSDQALAQYIDKCQQQPVLNMASKTKPLFRLNIINNEWIFACFDHLFFDGMSGVNFHKTLLSIMISIITSKADEITQITSNDKLQTIINQPLFSHATLSQSLSIQNNTPVDETLTTILQPKPIIPLPMEFYVNCTPSYSLMTSVIAGAMFPKFVTQLLNKSARLLGVSPSPTQYDPIDGIDQLYVYREREVESKDDTNSSTSKSTPESATTITSTSTSTPKYINPITFRLTKFDGPVRIIRISSSQLNSIKTNFIKPFGIRISIFLSYLFSLVLLPITLEMSTGCSFPANARKFIQEGYEANNAFWSTTIPNTTSTNPHPLIGASQFDFGCCIGAYNSRFRSLLHFIPSLQHWLINPPNDIIDGVNQIKAQITAHINGRNNTIDQLSTISLPEQSTETTPQSTQFDLINTSLLQHLSKQMDSVLNTPTSNYNGAFNGQGTIQVAEKLMGIDKALDDIASKPRDVSTLEVSNLGAITFQSTSSLTSTTSEVDIVDTLFSQPSSWGPYFHFNCIGLQSNSTSGINAGGINLTITTIPFFSLESFNATVDLLQFIFDNIAMLPSPPTISQ